MKALTRPAFSLGLLVMAGTAMANVAMDSAAPQAKLAQIQSLQRAGSATHTRFTFGLSEEVNYHLFTLRNPDRVVLDFKSVAPGTMKPEVSLQDTSVTGIRTGIQADGTVRYVFDMQQASNSSAVYLRPADGKGHRLALDIATQGNDAGEVKPPSASSGSDGSAGESKETKQAGPAAATQLPPGTSSAGTASKTRYRQGVDEWSGYVSLSARVFFGSPEYSNQDDHDASIAFEPEYFKEWDNGRQQLSFVPFGRLDSSDNERSHADIRELYWRIQFDGWSVTAGADVVFWGVTESQHLVDIINQTDLVENIDGEDKLGQPMLNLNLERYWGTVDFYLLPWFRERTFPGKRGRLRPPLPVDTNNALYESGDEEDHIDYALRWSHYIGNWDIGLAHFSGTSRDPLLVPEYQGDTLTRLSPFYDQIDQSSLDVQSTIGQWLLKLEAIYNSNSIDDYYAYVGGFEYTLVGVGNTRGDVGLLLEYHYDERDDLAVRGLQDDIYTGLRWTGNDHNSTEILAGVFFDTDSNGTLFNLEASRRLGESWILSVEARTFQNADRGDPLYYLRADDYIELEIARHF